MDIPKFQLYRMGSDPEALFVKAVDFDWVITPAYDIIGKDKKKTTSSFIGTDSRPVIAEIRPNPARNLKRHLYELAHAVVTIQDYLDSTPKWKGTKMLAYPHLHGENLGGHIHASMFVDDPLYKKLKQRGFTLGVDGNYLASLGGGEARNRELEAEIISRMNTNSIVTPQMWGGAMGYLLTPFEKWIQPWVARETRNTHYGLHGGRDTVRLGTSHTPYSHKNAYVHWEYRLPSTWLQHPWLAYGYLGLAKLSLLNMTRVFGLYLDEYRPKKPKGPVPDMSLLDAPTNFTVVPTGDPAAAGETLRQNLARLSLGARVSKDLASLGTVLEQCNRRRGEWFSRPTPIDVEAWRKLL